MQKLYNFCFCIIKTSGVFLGYQCCVEAENFLVEKRGKNMLIQSVSFPKQSLHSISVYRSLKLSLRRNKPHQTVFGGIFIYSEPKLKGRRTQHSRFVEQALKISLAPQYL